MSLENLLLGYSAKWSLVVEQQLNGKLIVPVKKALQFIFRTNVSKMLNDKQKTSIEALEDSFPTHASQFSFGLGTGQSRFS